MKYGIDIGSGVMIYKFQKDLFRHSKVNRRDSQTRRHTDSMEIS
jgi:hypothetical protein